MTETQSASTIERALSLLEQFTDQSPEFGLSDMARKSGFNKATTLRFLNALAAKGFVEQDETTKAYRLGPAFLLYSQLREARFPLKALISSSLQTLAATTGETALASMVVGGRLANVGQAESERSNRVILRVGEALPFHATASGLAYLSFASDAALDAALARPMTPHTPQTPLRPDEVRATVIAARRAGWAKAPATFEPDVIGYAAPYFGAAGEVVGALAIAAPTVRATSKAEPAFCRAVMEAARHLTQVSGGRTPGDYPELPSS